MQKFIKEKLATITSSASGVLSFLGGYQICHNICMWIIALLSILGITVVGMPLLFLNKVAIPFWIAALVLFIISFYFYIKMKCISRNILILNSGILIAGVPFTQVQDYIKFFWIIGGTLFIIGLSLIIKDKIK